MEADRRRKEQQHLLDIAQNGCAVDGSGNDISDEAEEQKSGECEKHSCYPWMHQPLYVSAYILRCKAPLPGLFRQSLLELSGYEEMLQRTRNLGRQE